MNDSIKEAARAARNEALRRHRKEVEDIRTKMRMWMAVSLVILLAWGASEVYRRIAKPPASEWRSDKAPALQLFRVVTDGYIDKRGNWRSGDTGEEITVYHWTTQEP
jgi:hypothetical protein